MGDPSVINIAEWQWQKVATSVITGVIHRLTTIVYYYQTFRLTGEAAPAAVVQGTIPDEGVRIFDDKNYESISASEPIDVYIMCANSDSDASDSGKVRVDV